MNRPSERQLSLPPLALTRPGLAVVGVDEGVGQATAACLIADQLARRGIRVGPCQPIATGCVRAREGLVSRQAENLAYLAQLDVNVGPLSIVSPVRYRQAAPPALALMQQTQDVNAEQDYPAIGRALKRLDEGCEMLLVDAPGEGLMTPLDRKRTTMDLLLTLDFPVVLVVQPTARMVNLAAQAKLILQNTGLRTAGFIVNGYNADHPGAEMQRAVQWLGLQTRSDVLAMLPPAEELEAVRVDPDLQAAMDVTDFVRLARPARWQ